MFDFGRGLWIGARFVYFRARAFLQKCFRTNICILRQIDFSFPVSRSQTREIIWAFANFWKITILTGSTHFKCCFLKVANAHILNVFICNKFYGTVSWGSSCGKWMCERVHECIVSFVSSFGSKPPGMQKNLSRDLLGHLCGISCAPAADGKFGFLQEILSKEVPTNSSAVNGKK